MIDERLKKEFRNVTFFFAYSGSMIMKGVPLIAFLFSSTECFSLFGLIV